MAQNEKPKQDKMQYALNMGLAGLAGTVGAVTLGIVIVALVAGIFLDRLLDTKPLFTILILLGSMPISLYVMFRLALGAVSKIQPAQPEKKKEDKTSE